MVKRCVRVYIEGGAEGRGADADFRRGWKAFLIELHDLARIFEYHELTVIRCKGRANAYHRFVTGKSQFPDDLCVLLVDFEMAVPTGGCVWDVVARRDGDKWQRPQWATERHLYLMVHFVETWLLTDQDALSKFFKRNFNPAGLPTTNLEDRSKQAVEAALKKATKDLSKGPYQHGQAHEIIEIVRPERVRTLTHGRRLFDVLGRWSEANRRREPRIIASSRMPGHC